jgi:hypothetical protein
MPAAERKMTLMIKDRYISTSPQLMLFSGSQGSLGWLANTNHKRTGAISGTTNPYPYAARGNHLRMRSVTPIPNTNCKTQANRKTALIRVCIRFRTFVKMSRIQTSEFSENSEVWANSTVLLIRPLFKDRRVIFLHGVQKRGRFGRDAEHVAMFGADKALLRCVVEHGEHRVKKPRDV